MILQALYRLAEQEGLVEDPDFEIKSLSWMVRLSRDGGLLQIVSQRHNLNEGTKRKPKYEGKPILVPRQSIRTSGDSAFFLVDKSEYVFGFDPADARSSERLSERLALFRSQVEACAVATKDPDVSAVLAFLRKVDTDKAAIRAAFEGENWAANDLFGFSVGLNGEPVHLRPVVRDFWKELRAGSGATCAESRFRCLVTNELIGNPGLFPLLKRVPGGTASGVSLVSFNSNAFESFGLKGNENAPISRAATEQTATALNRLLHDAYPNPHEPGTTLPRHNVRLGADTVACFWTPSKDGASQEFTDALPDLLEADTEESVGEVYRSVWRGREIPLRDTSAFYVLLLSGAQGRAVVRDWIETTLIGTMTNLAAHFADLHIVRGALPKKGSPPTPAIPLRWLMDALAPEGRGDSAPASLEAGFMRAAITGGPYPFQILQRALVRARAEGGRGEWFGAARRDARAAMLKAVLNRRRRFDSQARERYPEVSIGMNPQIDSDGYVLGVLMAVLERLQAIALGDVNASVIDRYFSAASATPRAVFVRLLKNSQHHIRKALDAQEASQRGQAARLRRIIDEVCTRFQISVKRFPTEVRGLPAHLDLEQQGLFVLGYHQMRHWLWMSNETREDWEKEHPDASAAYLWIKRRPKESGTADV